MKKPHIRPIEHSDEDAVVSLLQKHWSARQVVSRGRVLDAAKLPGFIAQVGESITGLLTMNVEAEQCEVVTLDAFPAGKGTGTLLIAAAEQAARMQGSKRLWLVTSNDNVGALAFYQKYGFRIVAVHSDAITAARRLKPQIPLAGKNGIPIRDEIELEILLK